MHTHLLDSRTQNSLAKSVGLYRLDLCLLILQHLEHNYPAAATIRTLFLRAKQLIDQPQAPEVSHGTNLEQAGSLRNISDDVPLSVDSLNSLDFDRYYLGDIYLLPSMEDPNFLDFGPIQ